MPKKKSDSGVIVCLRFRPLNGREKRETGKKISVVFNKTKPGRIETVELTDAMRAKLKLQKTSSKFKFDYIFNWESTQSHVYEQTAGPMIKDVFKGINCTVFAYGQTGSGKSFSMMGPENSNDEKLRGIIPRIVGQIFDRIDTELECEEPKFNYEMKVSYVEIYMERLRDLLDPKNKKKLRLREKKNGTIYIENVVEHWVTNADEVYRAMDVGASSRVVAHTEMNSVSSRSHSVFILTLSQISKETGSRKTSSVFLVDLAGSEKVRKTDAKGTTLEEAKQINKSLSALGNVINALTTSKAHVPYRDSTLTRLLSNSLGGNAKTCLVITASPSTFNAAETHSTMMFGKRAKMMKNKPKVNAELTVEEYKKLLAKAEATIKRQQALINALRGGEPLPEGLAGLIGDVDESDETNAKVHEEGDEKNVPDSKSSDAKAAVREDDAPGGYARAPAHRDPRPASGRRRSGAAGSAALASKIEELLKAKEVMESDLKQLREDMADRERELRAAGDSEREARAQIMSLREQAKTAELETRERFQRERALERQANEAQIEELQDENKTLKLELKEQEQSLHEKIKSFLPSFEKVKEDAAKAGGQAERRIKRVEEQNRMLLMDLTSKVREHIKMSCALDELRSRQRLIEELGLKGLQARENAELKQKLADVNARNKSHQELARLRKSQMGVLQEQYEKALAQSRQYKQAMEEAKARVTSLMRAMQPRVGGDPRHAGRRRTRVWGVGGSGFRRQVTGRRMIRSPTRERQGSPTSPRTITTRTSGRTDMTSLLGSAPQTRLTSTEDTHESRHLREDDDIKTKISDEDALFDDTRRSSTRRGTILPPQYRASISQRTVMSDGTYLTGDVVNAAHARAKHGPLRGTVTSSRVPPKYHRATDSSFPTLPSLQAPEPPTPVNRSSDNSSTRSSDITLIGSPMWRGNPLVSKPAAPGYWRAAGPRPRPRRNLNPGPDPPRLSTARPYQPAAHTFTRGRSWSLSTNPPIMPQKHQCGAASAVNDIPTSLTKQLHTLQFTDRGSIEDDGMSDGELSEIASADDGNEMNLNIAETDEKGIMATTLGVNDTKAATSHVTAPGALPAFMSLAWAGRKSLNPFLPK